MTAAVQEDVGPPADAIPRDYNFADDLFRRFADKGWLDRTAYIDPRGSWTYGQLAERAEAIQRGADGERHPARRARADVPRSTPSTGRPSSSARSMPAASRCRSTR